MGTDYVDVYYIHWPNPDVPLADTIGALERQLDAGKVRAIAVCNFGPKNLTALANLQDAAFRPVAHQLPYNLLWRAIEGPILDRTRAMNMPVVAYSALAQGLLTGQYGSVDEVPRHLRITRFYRDDGGGGHGEPGAEAEIFAAIASLHTICREADVTMPQLALAWLLAKDNVASVLVGARSPREVAQNIAAVDRAIPSSVLDRATIATAAVRAKLGDNPDMWMSGAQSRFI